MSSTAVSSVTGTVIYQAPLQLLDEQDPNIFSSLYETPLGEQVFAAINKRVFDKSGSSALYARTFGDEWYQKPHQLLLMLGCDGGLMLSYLEAHAQGEGRRVLVIELPEMIEWINEHVDYDRNFIELVPAHGNLSILNSEKYNGYLYRNAIGIHRCLATLDQFHPAYQRLWQEYESLIHRFFFNHMVEIHGSSGFVNAQLLNLADNRHSIHLLYGKFKGGVVILLAGGPSLDQAIDWVKANRNRVTVAAVARVSARLKKEGIDPDFIAAVDPNEISFDNSKNLLDHYEHATFLHAFHVNPRLLSQWRGKAFYHGKRYPWFKVEPEVNEQYHAPGPTVTNTLISFLVHFGFETILFAGVDMCHKPDGQSHESGSIESQVGRFVGTYKATQFVTTNSGRLASTTPDLFTAYQVLQVQVTALKAHYPQLRFINPSSDSAAVDGVDYVLWSALALPEWENHAPTQVESIIQGLPFKVEKFLKESKREVLRMRKAFAQAKKSASAGKKQTSVLFNDSLKVPERTTKVQAAQKAIAQVLGDNQPMLIDYAPSAFHKALTVDVEKEQSRDDIKTSLTDYFTAVETSCQSLIDVIDACKDIIELRLLELKTPHLTAELVRGWMRYGQPGRLYAWLDVQQRSTDSLSDVEQSLAYPLIRAYEAIFKVQETGIHKKFKASVYDNTMDSVIKAMQVIDEASITTLDEMLAFCEENAEQDDYYRSLGLFILGYFQSVRGDRDGAYQAWSLVDHDKLREQAQISHLTLALSVQNYDQALQVLERLCVSQPAYMTVYANILISLKQPQYAIEVLRQYVKQQSTDMAARLQLAQLLIESDRSDEAYPLLEKAYQQSPNNPIVQKLFEQVGGQVLNEQIFE
jgi:tetratricopeptide (TPR) repeat protein